MQSSFQSYMQLSILRFRSYLPICFHFNLVGMRAEPKWEACFTCILSYYLHFFGNLFCVGPLQKDVLPVHPHLNIMHLAEGRTSQRASFKPNPTSTFVHTKSVHVRTLGSALVETRHLSIENKQMVRKLGKRNHRMNALRQRKHEMWALCHRTFSKSTVALTLP